MLLIPGNISTGSTSQLCSERSKFSPEDFLPLKVCLRFNPSSIALYYKLSQFPKDKFLHQVDIEKEIESNMTAAEIYSRLVTLEPMYWSPNNISKDQIMRLIEKLIEKNSRIRQWVTSNEFNGPVGQSPTCKIASISSSACCAPELVVNANELLVPNAESIILTDPELNLNEKDGLGRDNTPQGNTRAEENKEHINKTNSTNNKQQEGINIQPKDCFNEVKPELNKNHTDINEERSPSTNGIEEQEELEIVYIEELKQRAYMDKAGTLYDFNRNVLGIAEKDN